jgi:thymidine phosphorylase
MSPADAGALALELILAKRRAEPLLDRDIEAVISGYLEGSVAEAQMAALLMAICWRGLSRLEVDAWTRAMISSGIRQDLSGLSRPTVDKHSTGGVGDKVSLVLVPLVAACGAAVPQLSGRGLGHTGGTLDKMESIPGWRSTLAPEEMVAILEEVGCVICAASPDLAPADRRLYALRDVTGTVESIPLIASSIMSKKVAEGTGALLLDVKVGSGAFMADREQARELALTMIGIGRSYGVTTRALLTDQDQPLGMAVGNAIEVGEAIDTLRGGGPRDLRELVLEEARLMLAMAGLDSDPAAALADGRAWRKFSEMVRAQGGDPEAELPKGESLATITASGDGFLERLDARSIGVAAWRLGAGRARAQDPVSPVAGVLCRARRGDRVVSGQPLLELFGEQPSRLEHALQALEGAIRISPGPIPERPQILERLGPEDLA